MLNILKNKKIIFLGSSVTYGALSEGYSFVEVLRDRDGIEVLSKEAVSGTTLTDSGEGSYVARMKKIRKDIRPDMMICQLSTNDAMRKMPIGKISEFNKNDDIEDAQYDTSTIIGAMEYIIHYTYTTWNCPITFYTGAWFDNREYSDMVKRLLELSKKWDFYVIDMYTDEEFNHIEKEKYAAFMADPIHPNREGYCEWWTPFMERELVSIFTLELAKRFAAKAHEGQKDKAGEPYINHPTKVAGMVDTYEEKIVAYLHDTVEDTDVTIEKIEELFGTKVAGAVSCLTHKKQKDYYEYIESLFGNKTAIKVKIADLTHNMDITRIPNPKEQDYQRVEKYKKVYEMLIKLEK